MVDVVGVTVLSGFRVRLRFDDGSERELDVRRFLQGPVFEPLVHDRAAFEAVRVDHELGTIVWPTGADIDPDVLYEASTPTAPGKPETDPFGVT
jgi:hypothetical protein